jgi:hypothetical protein
LLFVAPMSAVFVPAAIVFPSAEMKVGHVAFSVPLAVVPSALNTTSAIVVSAGDCASALVASSIARASNPNLRTRAIAPTLSSAQFSRI